MIDFLKNLHAPIVVITDPNVKELYGDLVAEVSLLVLPGGEENKTQKTLEMILNHLQQTECGKETTLVALGGGTVTDVVGFAASIYLRGVPLILIPTTIVAMVDAAIGGKTAINTAFGKNLIGTFYDPEEILIDFEFLNTLPQKERFNGFAEIIKTSLVYDASVNDVAKAIQAKRQIVQQDPREKGLRRILNFGHTIGHALEIATDYQLSHGEAVAIGCLTESHLSMKEAGLSRADFEQIQALYRAFPLRLPNNTNRDRLMQAMLYDKKNKDGAIHFVLIDRIGHALPFGGAYCRPVSVSDLEPSLEWMEGCMRKGLVRNKINHLVALGWPRFKGSRRREYCRNIPEERSFKDGLSQWPQNGLFYSLPSPNWTIHPSQLSGHLRIPPSKSHTLRAILFAALARGRSRIEQPLPSPDTQAMIRAVRSLGAPVIQDDRALIIDGFAGKPGASTDVIDCGNSGQVLRFIGALGGLVPHYTVLAGDASIRRRPIQPLVDGLNQLGAFAHPSPLTIRGPLIHDQATISGIDSQPVSGLLIAAAFAPHSIELHVTDPGERPWVDLTLHWFQKLGIPYEAEEHRHYRMRGPAQIDGFFFAVPGDFSSAAFPIAAALVTHSELTLSNLEIDDPQGDKELIAILQQMGARFQFGEKTLKVEKNANLKGQRIDVNDCIDALPILAVIGCFAQGRTELINAANTRNKESDRIHCIACELRKMGAQIAETADGLIIDESPLHGARVSSHNDHRIALSLAVAALRAHSPTTIEMIECTAKSYPQFAHDLRSIGARIECT